jgi:acyl-CoA thioester hydrolase
VTQLRHRVEHVETDASGVVHFSRYASLVEMAALEEMEHHGAGLDVFERKGLDLRVRELRISYRSAARFRDGMLLVPTLEHVGPASLRISVKLYREGSEPEPVFLAVGSLDMAVVNRESGGPVCMPEELRAALKQAL